MYAGISYSMIGFEWTAAKFFWYWYLLFFGVIAFTYYGMMMVALTPNATLATICASFFYGLFNLFSGFLILKPVCPTSTLPFRKKLFSLKIVGTCHVHGV
jgi:hypothetical protein